MTFMQGVFDLYTASCLIEVDRYVKYFKPKKEFRRYNSVYMTLDHTLWPWGRVSLIFSLHNVSMRWIFVWNIFRIGWGVMEWTKILYSDLCPRLWPWNRVPLTFALHFVSMTCKWNIFRIGAEIMDIPSGHTFMWHLALSYDLDLEAECLKHTL